MISNYLTIAIRNLRRESLYSFINIAGLAVGLAASLVIFLYVYGEWSHDRHFPNKERIYRIAFSFFNIGQFAKGPELLGDYLPAEYDNIESFTRLEKNDDEVVTVADRQFKELVYYADSSFFQVFQYDFIEGNARSALAKPQQMVITKSVAEKYFGEFHALGRTLEIGKEKIPYQVTGIVKDDDRKSHLKARIWVSHTLDMKQKYYWTSASVYNYVLLKEGTGPEDLEEALDGIIANHIFPTSGKMMGKATLEEYLADPNAIQFYVQPLEDIYLKSKLNLELSPGGNETNVLTFAIIAMFILVLASVNFVNLATARASRRAREVGIRKCLGTTRSRLMLQFLSESVLISVIAMIAALGIAELFTFSFFWITGSQLSISIWANAWSFAGVLAFTVLVGLVSGIYPAFYLTSFDAAKVLKGSFQLKGRSPFRNGLVIFQFTVSIALIIGTSVIIRQLSFMGTKDLGFAQENTLTIDNINLLDQAAVTWREELKKQPGVINTSLHVGEPGSKRTITMNTFQTDDMVNAVTINTYFGDDRFVDVMGFTLLMGRDFDENLASDTASVILNESAVTALGLGDNPVGAVVNKYQKVIGVVRDFHWESLRNEIAPVAILLPNGRMMTPKYSQLSIKMNSSDVREILAHVERLWKQRVSEETMEYHFLDENFAALLEKEETLARAIGFFTVLAIIISSLGLFGLAAYTTHQRTKEIGIRKILGASVGNIVMMLNKEFTRLVAVAALIAIPVTHYVAEQWLSGFAYKIDLNFWLFALGAFVGLVISYATVAFHSLRASHTNPVETLKCE